LIEEFSLMQFLEKEIQEYTQLVCSTALGLKVLPLPGVHEVSPTDTASGSIQISGEWNGAIMLSMPSSLVNTLTETLFSLATGKATSEDRKDAIGELINMVGGNIKALLPEPSVLSTPIVALEGNSPPHFPATKMKTHCQFECQGKRFGLSLFEQV
jgi:chemotaxis protein CheX